MFYLANFDCEEYGFESFLLSICRIRNLSELLEFVGSFGLGISYPRVDPDGYSYELQRVAYGSVGTLSAVLYKDEYGDLSEYGDPIWVSELCDTGDGIVYKVESINQIVLGLFDSLKTEGNTINIDYKVNCCKYITLYTDRGLLSLYPSYRIDLLGGIPEDQALQIFEEISESYFQLDFEWYG